MPNRGAERGRRDFRRWPTPPGVGLDLHDGSSWRAMHCVDIGVGGARIATPLPAWMACPAPGRLRAPDMPVILVLADMMWQDRQQNVAGLRFEFQEEVERETWYGGLIDALLARHSIG